MQESGANEHTSQAEVERTSAGPSGHYAVLGVEPDAGYDEVRRAFHQGAKRWHPDRYMAASDVERADAQRHMRAVLDAYGVLADPARRAVYDAQRLAASRQAAASSADHQPDPYTYTSWQNAADDPEAYDRLYANNDPRGVANFLGVLLGLVALGLLWSVLHGAVGIVYYLGLAGALALGIAALWCIADPAGLATAAERMAGGASASVARKDTRAQAAAHTADAEAAHNDETGEDEDAEFERLVDEALGSIPDAFQDYLRNVVVRVKPRPSAEEHRRMRLREGETLFGLYEGVMLPNQGAAGAAPEVITIFQWPIERACAGDPARIREQVRRTVLHELAHHFGLDHDAMPEWIK